MNDLSSIGVALRRRRTQLGLEQAEVGRRSGLSQQAIAKWEVGGNDRQVRFERLAPICAALGVRPYDLLEEAGVADQVSEASVLPLNRHLAWEVSRGLSPEATSPQQRLLTAELLRKQGCLSEADRILGRIIADLAPLVERRPRDVELAAVLFEAHDLRAAVTVERLGQHALGPIAALGGAMDCLADGPLAFDGAEYRARSQFRRADAHLVSKDRTLFARGAGLAAASVRALRDPDRRLNALRVQAALARRISATATFDACFAAMRRIVDRGLAAPATICLAFQGVAGNLAVLPSHGKAEAISALETARAAYGQAVAASGLEDSHLAALLHRTTGQLAALRGPSCELERAEAELRQGLELAEAAGRQRTADHCASSLRVVSKRQPLAELPL